MYDVVPQCDIFAPTLIASVNIKKQRGCTSSSMLDIKRIEWFRVDAKDILEPSGMEEKVWTPLLNTIIAKAGRTSIADARDYIKEKVDEKVLPPEVAEQLGRLLERYKKWR